MKISLDFIAKHRNKHVEDVTKGDIQQYILYLKKEKGLSAGTLNNYVSANLEKRVFQPSPGICLLFLYFVGVIPVLSLNLLSK